jgi:ubiquinone/menaquinone biosynthesis C-methylase UbiE
VYVEPDSPEQVTPYAAMFDRLSPVYDQTGVPFFGVMAQGLVDRLGVREGEKALDIGSGRGAVTRPLAEAVGPTGRVDALDLAPGMVRLLGEDTAHLPHVRVAQSNAADPRPPAPPYDVIASSMVIFFLDDPTSALARWRALLRPGGRVGVATFQPWQGTWARLVDLYDEFAQDPTPTDDRWGTDAGVEQMLSGAGFTEVRTESATYEIPFADAEEWRRWSLATPMGGLWRGTPESQHHEIMQRATELLENSRNEAGHIQLEVTARYTFGVSP